MFVLVLLSCLVEGAISSAAFNLFPVVPYPQSTKLLSNERTSINLLEFHITSEQGLLNDPIIAFTARRFERYFSLFKYKPITSRPFTSLDIFVNDPDAPLRIGGNERYDLTVGVSSPIVTLKAQTRIGIIRGIETFYQLYNVTDGTLPDVEINDWPRFAYRGLMLDTSRHFLSLDMIYKAIEAMSFSKLNVLHWHIVDDPSFPYYSMNFPEMSGKGAYDQNHVYGVADVANVIRYAELHGVIVIPEFDTPGHTLSWGKGIPNLLTYCPGKGTFGGDYGPINPTLKSTYVLLELLFKEVSNVFPSQFLHLGGDEVPFKCWLSNPDVVAWMKQQKFKTPEDVENYYENRVLDIAAGLNRSYIVWEEIFNNGLDIKPDTIVHVWKGGWQATMSKIIQKGFRAIISSPWYLNYISFGRDWKTYYEVEPLNITGTPEQLKLVLGGEACMWGEFVDNTNLLSRTFPRASAVAERLWSNQKQRNEPDMEFRLNLHRCGMCARGVPAETVTTRGYCHYEFQGYNHQ